MFTELHKEEKREEGEVTRRRRGGIKRRETDLASNLNKIKRQRNISR